MSPRPTSAAGRRLLARIHAIGPFTEGSLTVTVRRCGRPPCRCASDGPVHPTALLTWKEDQTTHSLYVPVALRAEVATWVAEGQRLKQLMHEMSAAQREFLRERRRPRPR